MSLTFDGGVSKCGREEGGTNPACCCCRSSNTCHSRGHVWLEPLPGVQTKPFPSSTAAEAAAAAEATAEAAAASSSNDCSTTISKRVSVSVSWISRDYASTRVNSDDYRVPAHEKPPPDVPIITRCEKTCRKPLCKSRWHSNRCRFQIP